MPRLSPIARPRPGTTPRGEKKTQPPSGVARSQPAHCVSRDAREVLDRSRESASAKGYLADAIMDNPCRFRPLREVNRVAPAETARRHTFGADNNSSFEKMDGFVGPVAPK